MITFPAVAKDWGKVVKILIGDGSRVIAGTCMHEVDLREFCGDCSQSVVTQQIKFIPKIQHHREA